MPQDRLISYKWKDNINRIVAELSPRMCFICRVTIENDPPIRLRETTVERR